MIERRRHIRIDSENYIEDIKNAQVDVIVTFPDSTMWISNFYTLSCIESMRIDYLKRGRCLNGAYWCASTPVIIVDNVSRERIEQVIDELISNRTFEYVFEYLGPVQERELTRIQFGEDFFSNETKIDQTILFRRATQLKQMLDQSTDEVRTSIMKDVFGVTL